MLILGPFIQDDLAAPAPFTAEAVTFDGSNDYLERNVNPGLSDGKTGTISFWFYVTNSAAQIFADLRDSNNERKLTIQRNGGSFQNMRMIGHNSSNSQILDLRTNPSGAGQYVLNGWNHWVASWDLTSTSKRHSYLNNVSDIDIFVYSNQNIFYSDTQEQAIGALTDSSNNGFKLNGEMSEVYIAPNQYIDLSVTSNLRKFIDSSGKPVDLGSDGSTPTGTSPLIYFSGDASVWNSGTNKGSGGDFTMNGSVTDSTNEPVEL